MSVRLAIAVSAVVFGATPVAAQDWPVMHDFGWSVDFQSARVLRGNPIERNQIGDRVIFDIWRSGDDSVGTLTLNCYLQRYSVRFVGQYPLSEDAPVSDSPFTTLLASEYCARIDGLPEAPRLIPVI